MRCDCAAGDLLPLLVDAYLDRNRLASAHDRRSIAPIARVARVCPRGDRGGGDGRGARAVRSGSSGRAVHVSADYAVVPERLRVFEQPRDLRIHAGLRRSLCRWRHRESPRPVRWRNADAVRLHPLVRHHVYVRCVFARLHRPDVPVLQRRHVQRKRRRAVRRQLRLQRGLRRRAMQRVRDEPLRLSHLPVLQRDVELQRSRRL